MQEIKAVIGGEERQLKVDGRAMIDVEKRLAAGLFGIARKFADKTFGLLDVSVILHACMRSGGETVAYSEVVDMVIADRIETHASKCIEILNNVLFEDDVEEPAVADN